MESSEIAKNNDNLLNKNELFGKILEIDALSEEFTNCKIAVGEEKKKFLNFESMGYSRKDIELIEAYPGELQKLKSAFHEINNSDLIGLDSEWVVTKPPIKTTLFQIATRKKAYVFDFTPSGVENIYLNADKNSFLQHFESLLGMTFKNENLLKVSWDFKQDMYNLNNRFKYSKKINEILNFVDLMPISPKSIPKGLSNHCLHYLGLALDKTHQKSSWLERPLIEEKIIYAAMDSIAVISLYEQMKKSIDIKSTSLTISQVENQIREVRMKKKGIAHLFSHWEY